MNMNLARGFWAAAAGLALAAAFAAPAGAAHARHQLPAAGPARNALAVAAPGTQLWVARLRGEGDSDVMMAVSPHGSRVFVTGDSYGSRATGVDYETVAYSAATGRQLWASRYSGPGHYTDQPTAVAVSPDGATVFVTGYARGWNTQRDYATVAYSAATGRQLWASRYTSPGGHDDVPSAVAVSPDGTTVFVTGTYGYWPAGGLYATVAYNAATGKQLWASRYDRPPNTRNDGASSVAVSPDGATVFVTGTSTGQRTTGYDYATIAYRAATGRQLWASRYTSPGRYSIDTAGSVVVSPDGATVFVTGYVYTGGVYDYITVAYRAATGKQLWVSRYNGHAEIGSGAASMMVSPDGTTVFLAGETYGGRATGYNYATIAYRAATGKQLWASRYDGPAHFQDQATSIAVSPDGTTVYVTGNSDDRVSGRYATIAYRAATGRQLWASRYPPSSDGGQASSAAVSPDGATVYVTGTQGAYYATVAYRA